jgi:hypothetical protein
MATASLIEKESFLIGDTQLTLLLVVVHSANSTSTLEAMLMHL